MPRAVGAPDLETPMKLSLKLPLVMVAALLLVLGAALFGIAGLNQ